MAVAAGPGASVGKQDPHYGSRASGASRSGRRRTWRARGRIGVRWAEVVLAKAGIGNEATKLLSQSAQDLQNVMQSKDPVATAEAFYWRGKLYLLRKDLAQVGKAFEQGLQRARQAGKERKMEADSWQEVTLQDWCAFALWEANASLGRNDLRNARKYAEIAEARAQDLEQFNKAWAAWALYQAAGAKNWVTGLNKQAIEAKALPVLRDAVGKHPDGKSAWKWHWRLAEILGNTPGNRADALRHIRQGETGMPADALAEDRLRIATLRKQLEQGN